MENYEIGFVWSPLFSITQEEKNSFLEKIKDGKIGKIFCLYFLDMTKGLKNFLSFFPTFQRALNI